MTLRVLLSTTKWHPSVIERLTQRGAEIAYVDGLDTGIIAEVFEEFNPHAVLSRVVPINADAIAAAPALKVIAKHGTGVDNVDLDAATARGVIVCFSLGANSPTVAEHALALLFALARNIPFHDRNMRAGTWTRFSLPAHELSGKRLGLVGFGNSARHLAEMARVIGMQVAAYSPRYRYGLPPDYVAQVPTLHELLARSDVVSLHCPLTEETRGLIDRDAFNAMPKGAWLVNTARGKVVDETALLEALASGQLGRAALDCHAAEPMPVDHPLLALDNVVLTPHVAGSTLQSAVRTGKMAVDNVFKVLDGEPMDKLMIANPDVLDTPRAS